MCVRAIWYVYEIDTNFRFLYFAIRQIAYYTGPTGMSMKYISF